MFSFHEKLKFKLAAFLESFHLLFSFSYYCPLLDFIFAFSDFTKPPFICMSIAVPLKGYRYLSLIQAIRTSLMAHCRRPGINPWVGKIPRRREGLPTPEFWPGEFHGSQRVGHEWATFTSTSRCCFWVPFLEDLFWCGLCLKALLNLLQYCFCFMFCFLWP